MRIFAIAIVLLAGCSGENSLFDCTPGKQETCPCVGGGQGIQTCGTDGAYGACQCEASTGSAAGGSGGSSSSAAGSGGATGSGGGTGGAPAGCDLHPSPEGFTCIDGCPDETYVNGLANKICNSVCWGNVGGLPHMIDLAAPPQDVAFVFPADPFGAQGCANCQFSTGATWSYTIGPYSQGCARFTTSGHGGFAVHQGMTNPDSKCGAASPPSCLLFDGSNPTTDWDHWITYAAVGAVDPFWIRVETNPSHCQGNVLTCP